MSRWTTDIESILDQIRINCVYMSGQHKQAYFYYKRISSYFRIPTIILASVASVSSVGLQSYIAQQHISAITCLISLVVGIINSMELYLKLQENIENELEKSKQYYSLATDIYKVLNLDKSNRDDDANKILDDFYDRYRLLFQESNLMKNSFSDKLLKLPPKKKMFNYKKANNTESTISSSSSSSSSVGSEGQSPLNINTDTRYEEVELGKGGISNDYLEEQI
uniref:SMODS and SLOG-associating 2TM effector domain-containing protein n=1 Tax=viral metagenome TaxID=1070528 RepID=A0A6C0BTQ8_9ZZZZ